MEDLHGDADAVSALLDRVDRDVVLVGHSYGGAVISQCSTTENIARLVYLTALMPDEGQSASEQLADLPASTAPIRGLFVRRDDGLMAANPEVAPAAFYNTCDPAPIAAALARLDPQRAATLKQPTTRANWQTLPSTYIRCTEDQAIPLAAQDKLAERCESVLTIDTDHSPFVCAPDRLADLLAPLATD